MNNSDINIADILRDCPAGTPLYSRIAGKVELQAIDKAPGISHPIILKPVCQNTDPRDRKIFSLTPTGRFDVIFPNGECVLFPSLEMQDWTKFFRRGDVVVCVGLGVTAVFEGWDSEDYTEFRTTVEYDNKEDIWGVKLYGLFHTLDFRKATDNERAQFFAAAEAHYGGRFNSETLEFDKPKHPFKPFDRVLVRNEDNEVWIPSIFVRFRDDEKFPYQCIDTVYRQCIHYEGNEHLYNTDDDPGKQQNI
jgi:hypothetical protein